MSWAVGGPDDYGRWIGYGVPATCDQPGCGEGIAWETFKVARSRLAAPAPTEAGSE